MAYNEDRLTYERRTQHHSPGGRRFLNAKRELAQPRTPHITPNTKSPGLPPQQLQQAHEDLQASMAAMEKAKKAHEERVRAEAEKTASVRAAENRAEAQVLASAGFGADPLAAAVQGDRDGHSKNVTPQRGRFADKTTDELRGIVNDIRERYEGGRADERTT